MRRALPILLILAFGCESSQTPTPSAQPEAPVTKDEPTPNETPAAVADLGVTIQSAGGEWSAGWGRVDGGEVDELLVFENARSAAVTGAWGGLPAQKFRSVADRRAESAPTQGTLIAKDGDGKAIGEFPLQHTDVHARVSGYLAAVDVKQEYANPFDTAIEAVYTFPLPSMAAVNGFVMNVAGRKIVGIVRPRDEARRIYEQARAAGMTASLLTQERSNIFTQNVANIAPKERVIVEITYFERLGYEDKHYELVFPMVVAPRYIGGTATASGPQEGGTSPNTTQVPDASAITPPVGRSGHDISLTLDIDAGLPIRKIECASHEVSIQSRSASVRRVALNNLKEIPNRDFVCRWTVAGDETQFGVLAHRGDLGGFLTLMMQPPAEPTDDEVTPREITFILDVSGSMNGSPIAMAKEIIERTLDELRSEDIFNIVVFAGSNGQLWDAPKSRTRENVEAAKSFLANYKGAGGTEMLAGLKRALAAPHEAKFLRMYCFLTDGMIGSDEEILRTIREERGEARFFAFGPGPSVNRYLLDGIGEAGHGTTQYADPRDEDGVSRAVGRFLDAIDSPVLVDVAIDWSGLPVTDAYPSRVPDLFAGQTIDVTARYTGAARGTAYVTGRVGERRVRYPVEVVLPDKNDAHASLGPIWARHKIHELMQQEPVLEKEITDLAVDFKLVSKFTAFVAVDESRIVGDGKPLRILQPVELPEGLNYDTTVGGAPEAVVAWGVTLGTVDGKVTVLVGAGELKAGDSIESVAGTAVHDLRHLESLLLQTGGGRVEVGVSGRRVELAAP